MYLARCMVYWMWGRRVDPDNAAIPYLTALGDLFGIALLALSFFLLDALGDAGAGTTMGGQPHPTEHGGSSMAPPLASTVAFD